MKKILPSIISFLILISFVAIVQTHVHAQAGGGPNPPTDTIHVGIDNPFKGAGDCSKEGADCLTKFIETLVVNLILPIGAIVAVCMFIWTGFLFVKAQGNPSEIKQAKASLLYTSIGTAILLGAWVIMEVIQATIHELTTAANGG